MVHAQGVDVAIGMRRGHRGRLRQPDVAGRAARASGARRTVVYTTEVDGIIHPVATAYVRRAIPQADAAGAALLVIVLRTPGGLVDSTRDINTAIIEAKTPVAVFVAPAGSRAASAGFLITIAADVAAMAPGTHIGAAHPVSGDGQKVDDTMAKKMVSDVAGYARTLATQRKRNVTLVEQAVTESRTFTEQEALARESRRSSTSSRPICPSCSRSSMAGPSRGSTAETVAANSRALAARRSR